MSQATKDIAAQVAAAEGMNSGEIDIPPEALDEPVPISDWCCMYHILSLQSDFKNEKPLIHWYIEEHGHICLFLPKFHCELNPIEMLWGYAKYCEYKTVYFASQLMVLLN